MKPAAERVVDVGEGEAGDGRVVVQVLFRPRWPLREDRLQGTTAPASTQLAACGLPRCGRGAPRRAA